MAQSPTCLRRSYSQPSSVCSNEGDTLRALTSSISFGRFMSESLAWEKWSAFTSNRYLEEAEKSSKPGSVAAKKAYFEAHYKRMAAKKEAMLLEQESAAADNSSEATDKVEVISSSSNNPELPNLDGPVRIDAMVKGEAPNTEPRYSVITKDFEAADVGAETVIEQLAVIDIPNTLELMNQHENVENCDKGMSILEEKASIKDAIDGRNFELCSKKRTVNSSSTFKSSTCIGASKLRAPVQPVINSEPKKDGKALPRSKRTASEAVNKQRSTPNSLHMSMNFASPVEETSRVTSALLHKIGNLKMIKSFKKTPKDSLTQQNPTGASFHQISRNPVVTDHPENKRALLDCSVSRGRTINGKSKSPFTDHSETLSSCARKAQSPTVFSSFNFRSEERAVKHREFFQKLEEKFKAKEAGKLQLQARSKISPTESYPPKCRKNPTPSITQDSDFRPPWKPSSKADGMKNVAGKNNRSPTPKSLPRRKMHENASPNIQL